ncbi:MAG: sigma 54-interacting transcriptional regulator [Candidatus Latescibacterota bacterium]|jgi:PAS domain S-box-containing protein
MTATPAEPGSTPAGPSSLHDQIQACMMQRQNLEAIFNSVADGILAVDATLRVSNLNDATQQILGWPRREAVGESSLTVLGLAPEAELASILRERRQVDGYGVTIRTRQDHPRNLVVSTRVLRDGDGVELGVVAILRDVTELESLRGRLRGRPGFEGLVGRSRAMQAVYQLIEDLADSDATVLILGESGTGKERVAEAIHRHSRRRGGPFVKVNCSALSEGLLESELFGHVKGAFTGAVRDAVGRFEQAADGSIFLDEIGDLTPQVQVKLLRVLQEREIERVGSGVAIRVDTRVIAATHRNLHQAMREGQFRQDLFYRLNVMPVEVPPLRNRKEDIPLLVARFIERFAQQTGRPVRGIDDAALGRLMDHDWPGNVRELENAIEHAFVRCRGELLLAECLPSFALPGDPGPRSIPLPTRPDGPPLAPGNLDRSQVLKVLEECRWNRAEAAARLGMHRTTLWRRLREWGISDRGNYAS